MRGGNNIKAIGLCLCIWVITIVVIFFISATIVDKTLNIPPIESFKFLHIYNGGDKALVVIPEYDLCIYTFNANLRQWELDENFIKKFPDLYHHKVIPAH